MRLHWRRREDSRRAVGVRVGRPRAYVAIDRAATDQSLKTFFTERARGRAFERGDDSGQPSEHRHRRRWQPFSFSYQLEFVNTRGQVL